MAPTCIRQATEDRFGSTVAAVPSILPPIAMTLREQKQALREVCAERRGATAALEEGAAQAVMQAFFQQVPMAPAAILSVYWPIRDELDSRPLMNQASAVGHTVALPVVGERGRVLTFRVWTPGMDLVGGPFGTSEPPPTAPAVRPDVLVLPLLAFDAESYRLGYGGGYYDRTVRALRRAGPAPLVVGIAYAAQEVETVPRGARDERLDWIVTEREARQLS